MKKILICFLFILSIFIPTVYANNTSLGKTSLYIWNIDNIDYSSLDTSVNYLNIDTFYVGSYNNLDDYKHTLLFSYAKNNNIKIYLVYGEKIGKFKEVKDLTDKIINYNNKNDYKISGVAIDSEFHTTSEYKDASKTKRVDMFNDYLTFMKESYNYLDSKNLTLVSCIPVNYDDISFDLLEELIKDGSHFIQIMNYNKKGMITKIENEVSLAKEYNKVIESISELQEPGPNGVTDAITFWNDGIDVCNDKMLEVKNHYNYSKLKFSYHAYKSLIPVLGKKLDLSSEYNLVIKTNQNISEVYLTNDKEKIKSFSFYNKDTKEYNLYFYHVKYDHEYKITSSNYEVEDNIIKYNKSDERLFEVNKTFKKTSIKTTSTTTKTKKDEVTSITTKNDKSVTTKKYGNATSIKEETVNVPSTDKDSILLILMGLIIFGVSFSYIYYLYTKKQAK